MKRFFVSLFALSAALSLPAADFKILGRYPIAGTGGWDYITVDSAARRLYVSHATQVDVLDADTGKPIGIIPDTPGVHGIAISDARHGFTTNGREGKVSMFDPGSLKLIKKIDVGQGPDGIYFDPASKRVFTNNHGSHDITAIDGSTGEVVGTVKAGGDGEQTITGRDGMLYVNLENTSEVLVFDPRTLEVLKRFPLSPAQTPTGLAYDSQTDRLFVGCRSKSMVVMNAANGHIVSTLPIGSGVDAGAFDSAKKLVFFSNGDGTLSVFHEKSADVLEDAGAVTTQPSAKTMALDAKTGKIFLPAAQVETTPAAEPGGRPKRVIKDGTFGVLVVGK